MLSKLFILRFLYKKDTDFELMLRIQFSSTSENHWKEEVLVDTHSNTDSALTVSDSDWSSQKVGILCCSAQKIP